VSSSFLEFLATACDPFTLHPPFPPEFPLVFCLWMRTCHPKRLVSRFLSSFIVLRVSPLSSILPRAPLHLPFFFSVLFAHPPSPLGTASSVPEYRESTSVSLWPLAPPLRDGDSAVREFFCLPVWSTAGCLVPLDFPPILKVSFPVRICFNGPHDPPVNVAFCFLRFLFPLVMSPPPPPSNVLFPAVGLCTCPSCPAQSLLFLFSFQSVSPPVKRCASSVGDSPPPLLCFLDPSRLHPEVKFSRIFRRPRSLSRVLKL